MLPNNDSSSDLLTQCDDCNNILLTFLEGDIWRYDNIYTASHFSSSSRSDHLSSMFSFRDIQNL